MADAIGHRGGEVWKGRRVQKVLMDEVHASGVRIECMATEYDALRTSYICGTR